MWTREIPKKSGLYWAKASRFSLPEPVRLELVEYADGSRHIAVYTIGSDDAYLGSEVTDHFFFYDDPYRLSAPLWSSETSIRLGVP